MAEKLGLTQQGYAKIETGKSLPNLERINEIAKLFGVEIFELLKTENKSVVYQIGENYHGNNNYYNHNEKLQHEIEKLKLEIEKLKLIIAHKDELLIQKTPTSKPCKNLQTSMMLPYWKNYKPQKPLIKYKQSRFFHTNNL